MQALNKQTDTWVNQYAQNGNHNNLDADKQAQWCVKFCEHRWFAFLKLAWVWNMPLQKCMVAISGEHF